jgi:hypothetical protein
MCEFLGLVCASDTRTDLEYNEAEPCEGRDSKSDDQKRDTSGEAALGHGNDAEDECGKKEWTIEEEGTSRRCVDHTSDIRT